MERKTKIIATISDRRCSKEFIAGLYEAGMNVVRINSAHATLDGANEIVDNVRSISDKIAILIDTKGPEVRTSSIENDGAVELVQGEKINIKGGTGFSTKECIYISATNACAKIPDGASLLIDDGDIEIKILSHVGDSMVGVVCNSGTLKSHKSVNIPDVHIPLPSVTDKDKEYIKWAIKKGVDFIAHSFVRGKDDLMEVREIIDEYQSNIKIISKIENREGVDNIDEILKYSYGIMIARGDLGIEIPAEQIPSIQRNLVKKCVENKSPVIVATQMLQSMIKNPRATRAEVNDIASAIYQRADAIMLSGETASGDYPKEAVMTMDRVAREVEQDTNAIIDIEFNDITNSITAQLSRSAVRACLNLPITAVIIDTLSGRTGRYLSSFRGERPIYAVCYCRHVARELALSYGVFAEYQEPSQIHKHFLYNRLEQLENSKKITKEDLVVVVGGDYGAKQGASFLEICSVINLQQKYVSQNTQRHD